MRRAAALLGLCLLTGCAHVVRYTDELVQPQTGRSLLVRLPATFGAIVGFGVGLPIDIAALPVTWTLHMSQDDSARDPLSTFFFPSFVLWRIGSLIAVPFDALEWTWRSSASELGPEERERFERELDAKCWDVYPVHVFYPRPVPR